MLTPTVLHRFRWFHAFGNAPAINLARSIPHGQDASVLSLGCGDLSSILYTSYVQQGLREFPLSLHGKCAPADDAFLFQLVGSSTSHAAMTMKISPVSPINIGPFRPYRLQVADTGRSLARNLVILTMILAGEEGASYQALWDVYYHMYLDEQTTELVIRHVRTMIPMLESLETFNNGLYGSIMQICDEDTLCDVRRVLQRILDAAHEESRDDQAIKLARMLKRRA
jgi:hypothetical protein